MDRSPIVRISTPGMEWREIDLNVLVACARREMALRQRVYPKWIAKGTYSEEKAAAEYAAMRDIIDFLVHCLFKAVTRR